MISENNKIIQKSLFFTSLWLWFEFIIKFSFWVDRINSSRENALSKSCSAQIIHSLYFFSLNCMKLPSPILFVSKSGNTHSTQYPVAIFQVLSFIAISMTTQLSLSLFHTHIFCHISVATDDISSQFVDGIIIVNISVVYFFLRFSIFASISFLSFWFKIHTVSITYEFTFQRVVTSKARVFGMRIKKNTRIKNLIVFINLRITKK